MKCVSNSGGGSSSKTKPWGGLLSKSSSSIAGEDREADKRGSGVGDALR